MVWSKGDAAIAREDHAAHRAQSEREKRAREERRAARLVRIDQLRQQHAEAFSRPLISSDLLTEADRAAILDRVKNRTRWYSPTGL